jgi:hypothetical protein
MNPSLQSQLNQAISQNLRSLGGASSRNLVTLEKSFGPQPPTWTKQLAVDLERAYEEYSQILATSVEKSTPPDMAKLTRALEKLLTAAFCLQLVTRAAVPRVVVAQN